MPTKKKRAFTKKNSVKFLLLHGNEKAVNADGETLKNELQPIPNNYKPGSSLLMSRILGLANDSESPGPTCIDGNLNNILGQLDDASDSEDDDCYRIAKKKFKNLSLNDKSKKIDDEKFVIEEEFEDDGDDIYDDSSDFSDADSDLSGNSKAYASSSFHKDCPESLKILEERIGKKLEEYDDGQLGALDDEEICGYLTGENERVNYYLGSPLKKQEEEIEIGKCDETIKEKILKYTEEEHVEKIVEIVYEKPIEYDCESIISTYSNKFNHPVVIKEEGKIRKIKIPNNPLQKSLTKSMLKQLESDSESEEDSSDDNHSIATTINIRPKGETPEQKKERKNMFKEAKREARMLKKENKLAFKMEKKLLKAQAMNNQINRGIRLF